MRYFSRYSPPNPPKVTWELEPVESSCAKDDGAFVPTTTSIWGGQKMSQIRYLQYNTAITVRTFSWGCRTGAKVLAVDTVVVQSMSRLLAWAVLEKNKSILLMFFLLKKQIKLNKHVPLPVIHTCAKFLWLMKGALQFRLDAADDTG